MYDLKEKIVFVTGASSGIGRATVWKCAEAGAKLILNARSEAKLQALKKEIVEKHPECQIQVLTFDVRDREVVAQAIFELPEAFSSIDVLVNSAGLGRGRDDFHECSIDDWEEMIDTNIKGLLYVSHAVVQGMVARKSGTIVNISSVAGKEVYPRGNVYCGTKAAVRAISEGMRIDLVDHGIRVTDIEPAKVRTSFEAVRFHGKDDPRRDDYVGYTPLEAEDIADAIVFAASRPSHVQIAEMAINPTDQASAVVFRKKKSV